MFPITGDLGPTATYARRPFAWVPAVGGLISHGQLSPDGDVADELIPAVGKLTIRVQHGRGWTCNYEQDTYAVEEIEPDEPGTRLFLLLNLTDPTQREPYRVTVGGENKCRCIAGCVKRKPLGCKHRDALAVLAPNIVPELTPCLPR